MRRLYGRIILLFLFILFFLNSAHAQLTIEITKGLEGALPIAIVPFGSAIRFAPDEDIAAIIAADLRRSGRFDPFSPQSFQTRPETFDQIDFADWRGIKIDHVVVGNIRPAGGGRFTVRFDLADVFQGSRQLGLSFTVQGNELRRLAHHISDLIYEKLTGERGAFSTRIAYITAERGNYGLSVADADGFNPQVILRSSQPLMSPDWSPDGRQLVYVTFENRRAEIVMQNVYTGARQTLSSAPGINGAPTWSPDGRRLALTLSKDGNPEIYIYQLGSGSLRRMTNSSAIDTEPAWSPDGQSLVFTSDRGGNPQLYQIVLNGGRPERITFEGDYNARARFSPDGRYLTMVHRRSGRFHIAVRDMRTRELRVLTEGGLDESPSFAPNSRMIIYATEERRRGVLAAVSVDGRVRQRLVSRARDVREPAWSPFSN